MAAGKTDVPDSMQEGLQSLVPAIASIMAAPDADMGFLQKLQQVVLLRLHQPKPQQGAGPGAVGPPGAGGPEAGGGLPPSAMAPGGAPPGAGLPGGPAGGGAANPAMQSQGGPTPPTPGEPGKPYGLDPDEVRRVLAENAGP